MRPKVLLGLLATGWILVFAVWFVATPYLSVWNLERAAAKGDLTGISDHVDFEALRESIQANAAQRIQGVSAALPSNPLTALGATLVTAFAQNLVDAAVTPETVAQMLHGAAPGTAGTSGGPLSDFDLSMGYSAPSRFVVEAKRAGSTDAPIQLIFTRSGLATWRLTSMRDPTLPK